MPTASSVFSRIVFILSGMAVIGLAAWFIQTSLAPVAVPPPVAVRASVKFDSALDVSKNDTFFHLHPLGPSEVQPQNLGRANPFVPVTSAPASSTAATATQ